MKKVINYLLVFLVAFFVSIESIYALTPEDIYSNEALLVNLNTDEVLFHKNTNLNKVPIASLTKLMTYAVVLDHIDDLENTMITVPEGEEAYMISRLASRANLKDGYQYSALDLLYGMMLPSGCDAAQVLAFYVANGDEAAFTNMMNEKAQNLGMYNTLYVDSYGIGTATSDNYSTEEDQYILIKYLLNQRYFRQIISTEYYQTTGVKDGEYIYETVRNTDYLMGSYSGAEYYFPYAIGGKTGSLDVAGKCLITVASKGGTEVVAITLGVPNQYGDYNLTDNLKLLEYAMNDYTENITIDIGPEYRSLEIGKQHKIEATTSSDTTITWESEDPSVATVDQNGIVTGVSQGQTKINAYTSTGNVAYTYVSVNFYNGVHVKLSNGEKNNENPNGYDPIDMSILKNKGFDYVIIKATNGYGWDGDIDKSFEANFQSAVDNNMNIGIWVESYAETTDEATDEANHLLNVLSQVQTDKINLPVFYNVLNTGIKDPVLLENIIKTFATIVKNAGYEVVVENIAYTKDASKSSGAALETLNIDNLTQDEINLSAMNRQTPPDLKTTMSVNNTDVAFWNYKLGAYLGKDWLGSNPILSLMYMSYKKIETIHKEYIPEAVTETGIISNNVRVYRTYNYKEEPVTTTTVTTKEKTKDKDKEILDYKDNHKDTKEEHHMPFIFIVIVGIILLIAALLIKYLLDNKE